MEPSQVARALRTIIRGGVRVREPLAPYVTLRLGGPADVMAFPADEEDLARLLSFAAERGLPVHVLGHGSNVLVPDEGVRGLVVSLARAADWVRFREPEVEVGAGFSLPRLVAQAARRGLGGLEALAGVPGSVGGALCMNAGTGGEAIGDVTEEVRALTAAGAPVTLDRAALAFGYRASRLQEGGLVAVAARLRLRPGEREAIAAAVRERARRRKASQPLDLPNAGSVFKNPEGDHAGRLIEAAGCKGLRVGNAQVSPRHANFIVNLGGATAAEVTELMGIVYWRVRRMAGVALEPEVRLFGLPQERLIERLERQVS